MKKYRKDIERMGSAMKMVRNPKDWTPPGQETTPEQKAQHGSNRTPTPPSDPYGVKKLKATPQSERDKVSMNKVLNKINKSDPSGMQRMYKNTGRIDMVGHPGEYVMGGGAVGGFKTAKTLMGKAFEKGSKYVAKNQYKIVANTL